MHRIALSQLFSLLYLFLITLVVRVPLSMTPHANPIVVLVAALFIPGFFMGVLRGGQIVYTDSRVVRGEAYVSTMFWLLLPAVAYILYRPTTDLTSTIERYAFLVITVLYMVQAVRYLGPSILIQLVFAAGLHVAVYYFGVFDPTHLNPGIVVILGIIVSCFISVGAWLIQDRPAAPTE